MGEERGIVKKIQFLLQNQGFFVCFCCPFDIKTELPSIAKSDFLQKNVSIVYYSDNLSYKNYYSEC